MPPKYVTTIRQLMYWEYAKLIARAAGFEGNYGFIVSRYKKLASGEMTWSSSVRDYEKGYPFFPVTTQPEGARHFIDRRQIAP